VFYFVLVVFVVLLFTQVENWVPRAILAGIFLGLWLIVGSLAAMIAGALLSAGIIVASKVPKISKL
jgi:hypothetical protein